MPKRSRPQNDYEAAAEFYDLFYAFEDDIDFYTSLAKRQGGPVLDAMCGTGRVTLPIARAGVEVAGLDANERMLSILNQKLERESPEVRRRVRTIQGDIRTSDLGGPYAMILTAWSSLGEVTSPRGQAKAIRNFAKHLRPGGLLALHQDDPADVAPTEERLARTCTKKDGTRVDMHQKCVRRGRDRYDLMYRYELYGPTGTRRTMLTKVGLLYPTKDRLQRMLESAGLVVEKCWGDYGYCDYQAGKSRYIILIARKPGGKEAIAEAPPPGTKPGRGPPMRTSLSRSLWAVFFADTTVAASTGLFIMVYPLYIIELGGDAVAVGIIFAISLVMASISYLPGAILVHRMDRKLIMISSLFVPAISIVILYNATTWIHVLIAEAIWYMSNFGAPAFITYITEASPKEHVMRNFGFIYAGPALAFVIAPIAGAGVLYMTGEIRNIFPYALALRLAAPLFLMAAKSQLPRTVAMKSRKLLAQLFTIDRPIMERILLLVLVAAVLGMAVPYLPLFLSDMKALGAAEVNVFGAISYLGAALLSIILGEIGSRRGGTFAVIVTISCFIAGCAMLVGLDLFLATVLAVFLLGVMTAVTTILDSIVGLKAPEETRGGQLSVYLLAESVAMAPMPLIGGLLYDYMGPEWPFIIGAVLAVIMIVITLARRDITETIEPQAS